MCSKHPNQQLTFILIDHPKKGLYCQLCVQNDKLPQTQLLSVQQFIQTTKQEMQKKINEIQEHKKLTLQIDKLHMEIQKNSQQTLKQIQNYIQQETQQQTLIQQEMQQFIQQLQYFEQKSISTREAEDLTLLLMEKTIDIQGKQISLKINRILTQFQDQLNQVIICYNKAQILQPIILLQNNIESIFRQQQVIIKQKQNTIQSQQKSIIQKSNSQTTRSVSIENKQPTDTQTERSLTPQYLKIEQSNSNNNNKTERSLTPQTSKIEQNNNNNNKSYQFQSGNLFGETLKRTMTDRQQEQIRQQQNTSTSILSRSNLFPESKKWFTIKAHDKRISSIQVGQNCIFTSSYDKLIRAWDKENGKMIATLEGHTREVIQLKFKYETLASCGQDKVIRIWKHHPRWQLIGNLKGHQNVITCLDFLNPKQLLSGSEDQSIKIWDLDKFLEIYTLRFDFSIFSMNIIGEQMYVGGDGCLIQYQLPNMIQQKFIQIHESPIIIILQTKLYLITIDKDGIIKLLNPSTLLPQRELKDDYGISSALYIQQYNFLVLGLSTQNGEGKICFWSLDTLRKIKEIYDNGSGAGGLGWESPYLWSGHDNKRLESLKLIQ